jgi:hypothetical protein
MAGRRLVIERTPLGTQLLKRQHNSITARAVHAGEVVDDGTYIDWSRDDWLRHKRAEKLADLKALLDYVATPEGKAAADAWNRSLDERAAVALAEGESEQQKARRQAYRKTGIAGREERAWKSTLSAVSGAIKLLRSRGEPADAEAISGLLKGVIDVPTVKLAMEEIKLRTAVPNSM